MNMQTSLLSSDTLRQALSGQSVSREQSDGARPSLAYAVAPGPQPLTPDWWQQSCDITVAGVTRRMLLTNFAGRAYPTLDNGLMDCVLYIAPHERVLDIGGGDAPFERADVVTNAFPGMNARYSGRGARRGGGKEFVQRFAEELPFEDGAFDVAYCRMALEHALDPAAACREMMRVARRGFLETPSPLAEYLGGHPTHRWIIWVEQRRGGAPILVFRRKPYRRAPLAYALRGCWFRDDEFKFNWEWRYRNLVCTQFAWAGEFAFRVEEADAQNPTEMDYDDPRQAAEAHLDAALNSLRWSDVPTDIIVPDAEYAVSLCPDDACAHNTLGRALWSANRRDEARAAFQRAAHLAPRVAEYARNARLYADPARSPRAFDRASQLVNSPDCLHLVAPDETKDAYPFPDAGRCMVTPHGVERAARLMLSLPPVSCPVDDPILTRLMAEVKRIEVQKATGGGQQAATGTNRAAGTGAAGVCPPTAPSSLPPLIWQAPLRDSSGYADEARHFLFALDMAGIEVAARELRWNDKVTTLPPARQRVLQRLLTRPAQVEKAVQVCHILAPLFQRDPLARANVGRTMFETDRLPPAWVDACNQMDAVWVPSAFNVQTFTKAGVHPGKLRVVPGAIDLARYNPRCVPLRVTGARGFNFLSVFDWTLRKGWDTLLQAYVEEFRADEDVALILKTHSSLGCTGEQLMEFMTAYIADALGRDLNRIPDIILQDTNVPDAQMPNLYRAADCYVMPSRGEGWGRPYMEAMAMGLPVIAVGWSGQTAFLNAANSLVLDYTLQEVPSEAWRETPTYEGHKWAEPSRPHLRQLLRRSFEDRQEGRRLGQAARAHIETHFTYAPVAAIIAAEVERLCS